jgi:hypothetical protein
MGAPIRWAKRRDGTLYPQRMMLGIYQPEPSRAEIRQRAAALRAREADRQAAIARTQAELAADRERRARIVTADEIATIAGCTTTTARRWLAERRIRTTDGEHAALGDVEGFLHATSSCRA